MEFVGHVVLDEQCVHASVYEASTRADKTPLACADMQLAAVRDTNVPWNLRGCIAFLNELDQLWKDW